MRRVQAGQTSRLRSGERAVHCAVVVLLTLSIPARGGLAHSALPVSSVQVESTMDSLDALIHHGIDAYANGDLAGSDAVWTRVRALHPGHPAAATFELMTLHARRSLDYWGGEYEQSIRDRAEEAVRLSRVWLEREPDAARAHFYLGNALLEMMVIDGMDKRYYKAGSEGEEARKHLERALLLDPSFVDAKHPLGLYYYYGSIATRFIPFLRWLWFVPEGDRDLGLAYVQEASREAVLLGFDATLRLAGLYSYVEERPDLAEPMLIALGRRHPDNSMLHFELVELQFKLQDYPGTVATALALEHKRGTQFGDEIRRDTARIWRARAELHRGRIAEAKALVLSLLERFTELNSWSQRWLLVMRGQLHDLAGEREQAIAFYSRISQQKAPFGSHRTAELALSGIAAPFELAIPVEPGAR